MNDSEQILNSMRSIDCTRSTSRQPLSQWMLGCTRPRDERPHPLQHELATVEVGIRVLDERLALYPRTRGGIHGTDIHTQHKTHNTHRTTHDTRHTVHTVHRTQHTAHNAQHTTHSTTHTHRTQDWQTWAASQPHSVSRTCLLSKRLLSVAALVAIELRTSRLPLR